MTSCRCFIHRYAALISSRRRSASVPAAVVVVAATVAVIATTPVAVSVAVGGLATLVCGVLDVAGIIVVVLVGVTFGVGNGGAGIAVFGSVAVAATAVGVSAIGGAVDVVEVVDVDMVILALALGRCMVAAVAVVLVVASGISDDDDGDGSATAATAAMIGLAVGIVTMLPRAADPPVHVACQHHFSGRGKMESKIGRGRKTMNGVVIEQVPALIVFKSAVSAICARLVLAMSLISLSTNCEYSSNISMVSQSSSALYLRDFKNATMSPHGDCGVNVAVAIAFPLALAGPIHYHP